MKIRNGNNNNNNNNNVLEEELRASKDELNRLLENKIDGIILRSKATIIEYSEKKTVNTLQI